MGFSYRFIENRHTICSMCVAAWHTICGVGDGVGDDDCDGMGGRRKLGVPHEIRDFDGWATRAHPFTVVAHPKNPESRRKHGKTGGWATTIPRVGAPPIPVGPSPPDGGTGL